MTGDNNGRWAGDRDWPANHGDYLANAADTIKRLHNHPSLCYYGGGNELSPIPSPMSGSGVDGDSDQSTESPPVDIDRALRKLTTADGRPYVSSSVSDVGDSFDSARALAPKDGPYGIQPEEVFFDRNPGFTSPLLNEDEVKRNTTSLDVEGRPSAGRNIGFQTEVGSVSHPELDSLARLLSREVLAAYPDCGERGEVGGSVHEEWAYYKYLPFTDTDDVDHICQFKFPPANDTSPHRMDSVEEYSWAAQFAQYLQYKSLLEGYSHRMWDWYSAVFLWKTSSPAPTLRGALYDWRLAPTGAYWGARAGLAGGRPVRLILNLRDRTVHVANAAPRAVLATSVKWSAYSLEGVLLMSGNIPVPLRNIAGDSVLHLEGSLPWVDESLSFVPNSYSLQEVVLYVLDLPYVHRDDSGSSSSVKNSYYLTDPSSSARSHARLRFSLLGAMRKKAPRVELDVQCQMRSIIECTLKNAPGNNVAIMTKLTVAGKSSGNLTALHPALFSDNYITILPGATSFVRMPLDSIEVLEHSPALKCSSDKVVKLLDPVNTELVISVDGWNVQEVQVQVFCDSGMLSRVIIS